MTIAAICGHRCTASSMRSTVTCVRSMSPYRRCTDRSAKTARCSRCSERRRAVRGQRHADQRDRHGQGAHEEAAERRLGSTSPTRSMLRHGRRDVARDERDRLGLPVFVKPAHGGSSVGVSKRGDWDRLPERPSRSPAKSAGQGAGGGGGPRPRGRRCGARTPGRHACIAGPALEIRVTGNTTFFDYAAKYSGAGSVFDIPARLAPEDTIKTTRPNRRYACSRRWTASGCCASTSSCRRRRPDPGRQRSQHVSRAHPASQFPQIWQAAGVSYAELLDILVTTALVRRGRRDRPALPQQSGYSDRELATLRDRRTGSAMPATFSEPRLVLPWAREA